MMLNDQIEAYWQNLIVSNKVHNDSVFRKTVRIAQLMGFNYQPMSIIAKLPDHELVERVLALENATEKQVEAVLGRKIESRTTIKQALDKYWDLSKDRIINKTDNQYRKWKNPRIKAVENFISLVGNKA